MRVTLVVLLLHLCLSSDRVTALMKMYSDGKHDKLFKHGTVEENTRKETILRELSVSIAGKSKVAIPPASSLLEVSSTSTVGSTATRLRSSQPATGGGAIPIQPYQKRRRLESSAVVGGGGVKQQHTDAGSVALGLASISPSAASTGGGHLESDVFRARVLSLIESKVQFDMEQRIKETHLREQEFELQKRFLEYLQSK